MKRLFFGKDYDVIDLTAFGLMCTYATGVYLFGSWIVWVTVRAVIERCRA